MEFTELGLRAELLEAIAEEGYTHATPIQERAIPHVLTGRDLMCSAQTGTGKTAAFALPILQRLAAEERADLRALVLVPTRELAIQVGRSFREYGRYLELVSATAFGGVPIEPQEMMLRHGVDILVATPGRLKDHIWRGNIDFRHTKALVLDEADRMLDMGFIKDVREIVELLPTERQSMLFSATLEREIRRLAKDILIDPLRIEVAPPSSTLDEVDQYIVRTTRGRKVAKLESLLRTHPMKRTIIFARTKSGASRLASRLRERGHRAAAIHSDRSQAERVRTLEGFREGKVDLLVATDIAARGIDVDAVSHVVNFDMPYSPKDYVHRIGRTARAGKRGVAFSLATPEDARGIAAIERLTDQKLRYLGEREAAEGGHDRRASASSRAMAGDRSGTPASDEGPPSDGRTRTRRGGRRRGGRRRSGQRSGDGAQSRQPAARPARKVASSERPARERPTRERAPREGSAKRVPAGRNGGLVRTLVERIKGPFRGRRQ